MRSPLKVLLLLAAIWLVAGGIIFYARSAKPTAESVAAFVNANSLASKDARARAKAIASLQDMLNRAEYDERQEINRKGLTHSFFKQMNPGEQMAFLDATLPAGFKQMMESFNRMEPEKRRRILEKTLADMKNREGDEVPATSPVDEQMRERFIEQGMRSFYNDANADTKLDMAPIIEQMQKNLQHGR